MKFSPFTAATVSLSFALFGACASVAAQPATPSKGVLVGPNGMTLYTFDKDEAGKSMCNGPCATNWPPLKASASDKASGDFTVITREDGQMQWAVKGKPLYFWSKDSKPGDMTGDGFNQVWHSAKP